MSSAPGLAPRFAAWRILHDVRRGVPLDGALDRGLVGLEDADRRLAHEIAAGVFRHRADLDEALGGAVDRGLSSVRPDTLDILRVGAFQLRHLDRIPPHAAVQTTVAVAKRLGGDRVAAFVNAVLRRVPRTPPAVAAPPADDPVAGLARSASHPAWLVERWHRQFGAEATAALLQWNNQKAPLVVQPGRLGLAELERMFADAGIATRPAPLGAGLIVEGSAPTRLPGFRAGAFVVQDPAQMLVTRYLAPDRGGLLVDACAAPGGKTVALAAQTRWVLAADLRRTRTARLVETVQRAGSANVSIVVADARHLPVRQADAVFLDVPCLGTGTFARNPDARWRVSAAALVSLVSQASEFLSASAEVVRPGGLLLFATCSLEPEENQLQIDRFLARDSRFRREPTDIMPADYLSPEGDLLILPHRHGMDGAYAARLRRIAG